MRLFPHLFLFAALLGLTSCGHLRNRQQPDASGTKPGQPVLWGWDEKADAKSREPVTVRVVLKEQKAHVFKGKTEVGWSYVATGISKFPTPTGTYQILERTSDKHSNLYGRIYDAKGECINTDAKRGRDEIPEGGRFEGAQMAYWMRLTDDGLGMHVGPIPQPGSRASHGCVRLPREAAKKIFNTVRAGTQVVIVQNADDPLPPKRTVTPPLVAGKPAAAAKPRPPAPAASAIPGLPPIEDKPPLLTIPVPAPRP